MAKYIDKDVIELLIKYDNIEVITYIKYSYKLNPEWYSSMIDSQIDEMRMIKRKEFIRFMNIDMNKLRISEKRFGYTVNELKDFITKYNEKYNKNISLFGTKKELADKLLNIIGSNNNIIDS